MCAGAPPLLRFSARQSTAGFPPLLAEMAIEVDGARAVSPSADRGRGSVKFRLGGVMASPAG